MMKYFCKTIFLLFILSACNNKFELQDGDLLFSIGKSNSPMTEAIQSATAHQADIAYTHVGIVKIVDNECFVIEATAPEGVQQISFDAFMNKAATVGQRTFVAVGRLKPQFTHIIPRALACAQSKIGLCYDYAYSDSNNAYYCSELVQESFLQTNGSHLFPAIKMTFKNPHTNSYDAFWLAHFEKLGLPIPEGENGSNPAQLSKSDCIDIVHAYF